MRRAILIIAALTVLWSCEKMHDPKLHAGGYIEIHPELSKDASIDVMWEDGWRARWLVEWDESSRGPLGYSAPESYHMYFVPEENGKPVGQRDIPAGNSARLKLSYGYYGLMVYSNDYQLIRLEESPDGKSLKAMTGKDPYAALPDTLEGHDRLRSMPEQLFSTFDDDIYISPELKDYEYVEREGIWILRREELVMPRVYIYLLQAELLNDRDRIAGCGSSTMTGLAGSTEFFGVKSDDGGVAHQFPSFCQKKTIGGVEREFIAGRMITFGSAGQARNLCHLRLRYNNGGSRFMTFDVTDQVLRQPRGGVINIVIDIDDYPLPDPDSDGGWDTTVSGWEREDHFTTI